MQAFSSLMAFPDRLIGDIANTLHQEQIYREKRIKEAEDRALAKRATERLHYRLSVPFGCQDAYLRFPRSDIFASWDDWDKEFIPPYPPYRMAMDCDIRAINTKVISRHHRIPPLSARLLMYHETLVPVTNADGKTIMEQLRYERVEAFLVPNHEAGIYLAGHVPGISTINTLFREMSPSVSLSHHISNIEECLGMELVSGRECPLDMCLYYIRYHPNDGGSDVWVFAPKEAVGNIVREPRIYEIYGTDTCSISLSHSPPFPSHIPLPLPINPPKERGGGIGMYLGMIREGVTQAAVLAAETKAISEIIDLLK